MEFIHSSAQVHKNIALRERPCWQQTFSPSQSIAMGAKKRKCEIWFGATHLARLFLTFIGDGAARPKST